jgi:hypothetical protein
MRRMVLAFVFLVAIGGCDEQRPTERVFVAAGHLRESALGCYQVDSSTLPDSLRRGLLERIGKFQLRADPLMPRHPQLRRVEVLSSRSGRTGDNSLSGWSADSLSESIVVSIGDGFNGIGVRLAPAGNDWQGRLHGYTDFGPQRSRELGPVRVVRIPCPTVSSPARRPANDR